jgi:uncharacterized membrane protein
MAESLWPLGLATLAFVGGHVVLSGLRGPLIGVLGRWAYLGFYSATALAAFVWMCLAFADAPRVVLWTVPAWNPWPALALMAVACVLLVCGYLSPNPTAVILGDGVIARSDPAQGIIRVTRHPVMWAVALWACAHILSRGDLASLVFFGGFGALALGGAAHMDRRRRREGGEDWQRLEAASSYLPFAAALQGRAKISLAEIGWWRIVLGLALWLALAHYHGRFIGIPIAPWV